MTQTNHSELMNDMDRVTNELVRLMTAFGRVSAERNILQDNVTTLTQENFQLRLDISEAKDEADRIIHGKNALLKDEIRYADALHDSLSDMKMTLRRVNDELLAERESIAVLRKEYHALQEKSRKESEQLRSDLGAMYRLRDEAREELKAMTENRDTVVSERDQMYMEFKKEFDEHTQTIQESGNLRNAMGRTVAKYNELRHSVMPYLRNEEEDDTDSVS